MEDFIFHLPTEYLIDVFTYYKPLDIERAIKMTQIVISKSRADYLMYSIKQTSCFVSALSLNGKPLLEAYLFR